MSAMTIKDSELPIVDGIGDIHVVTFTEARGYELLVRVDSTGDVVVATWEGGEAAGVGLSPDDARILAARLLKAARWSEGDLT